MSGSKNPPSGCHPIDDADCTTGNLWAFSASNSDRNETMCKVVFVLTGASQFDNVIIFDVSTIVRLSTTRDRHPLAPRQTSRRLASPVRTSTVRPAIKIGANAILVREIEPSGWADNRYTPLKSISNPRGVLSVART